MTKPHLFHCRVYYEDTDAGGVVYHTNYLKYAERARTEYLRDKNINQSKIFSDTGVAFVVRHMEVDLFKSAKLDDKLRIESIIEDVKGASLTFIQHIYLEDILLATIQSKIASVHMQRGKPVKIPDEVKQIFSQAS